MPDREIIPIKHGSIGRIQQLTVDARALHVALKVKRDFSTWIKGRISKYGFVENEDYVIFAQDGENLEKKSSIISRSPDLVNGDFKGLRQAIEYRLSLNMGKELSMLENNEIGRIARRYFIECERKAMEPSLPTAPLAPFLPPPRYLPPVSRRRLVSLVDAKTADVPSHHVWRARMGIWSSFNRRFAIPQYRLLPEGRMADAIAFLSSLEIGPHGKIILKDQQALPMCPDEDAKQIAATLGALVEQARSVLAALPESQRQETI